MAQLVKDLMHPGIITCQADMTLGRVAEVLMEQHLHALVVADRDGRPLGILSDYDLMAGEWLSTDKASLEAMRRMTAGELMTAPLDTIDSGVAACDAAQRMRKDGTSRLVVTERGKPVGIISTSDIVAGMASARPLGRKNVADVMSRAMLVCREETPLCSVARAMTDAQYRSVLVVDSMGRALGVVSGFDMMAYCGKDGCADVSARQAMHEMLTIRPDASLREAADMMIQHHHHRLVVVDPEEAEAMPVGMISTFDIVFEMAQPSSVWQK
jgi:predicted transcriptional regulator